jgi:hypothetical protein
LGLAATLALGLALGLELALALLLVPMSLSFFKALILNSTDSL